MNYLNDIQKVLGHLQDNTIGLFKMRGSTTIDLVINIDEGGLLKTVHIGQLGGVSTTHIPKNKGKLIMFDKGVTLGSLKGDNPYKLQEICDELNK